MPQKFKVLFTNLGRSRNFNLKPPKSSLLHYSSFEGDLAITIRMEMTKLIERTFHFKKMLAVTFSISRMCRFSVFTSPTPIEFRSSCRHFLPPKTYASSKKISTIHLYTFRLNSNSFDHFANFMDHLENSRWTVAQHAICPSLFEHVHSLLILLERATNWKFNDEKSQKACDCE